MVGERKTLVSLAMVQIPLSPGPTGDLTDHSRPVSRAWDGAGGRAVGTRRFRRCQGQTAIRVRDITGGQLPATTSSAAAHRGSRSRPGYREAAGGHHGPWRADPGGKPERLCPVDHRRTGSLSTGRSTPGRGILSGCPAFRGATLSDDSDRLKQIKNPPVRATSGSDGRFRFAVNQSDFDVSDENAPWLSSTVIDTATGKPIRFGFRTFVDPHNRGNAEELTLQLAPDDVPIHA